MKQGKIFLAAALTTAFLLAFVSCVSNLEGVNGAAMESSVDFRELAAALRDNLDFQRTRSETSTGANEALVPPDFDPASWMLKLVNAENPLDRDFAPELAETEDMYLFDVRAAEALDRFLTAGRQAGFPFALTSAYRSYSYQEELFENRVSEYISSGYTRQEAEQEAATSVARPGTSEHQIGLAADIVSENYPWLEEGFADSRDAAWLRDNCAEFGFILRYTAEKKDLTGIISEPWHYRYVGVEAARFIMKNGLCLEEFLELYN